MSTTVLLVAILYLAAIAVGIVITDVEDVPPHWDI